MTIQAVPLARLPGLILTISPPLPANVVESRCRVFANRGSAGFGRANPVVADEAETHPYAYSAPPDKATKATLAEKTAARSHRPIAWLTGSLGVVRFAAWVFPPRAVT